MKRITLIAGALLAIGAIRGCSSTQQVKAGNPAATGDRVSLVGTQRVLRDLAGSPALEKPQATLGFPGAGRSSSGRWQPHEWLVWKMVSATRKIAI